MSRGLGTLQRAILEAIDADPQAYRGWLLTISSYDPIREAVARRLCRAGGEGRTRSFDAAFSRALRTLGARGLIRYWPYMGRVDLVVDAADKR